MKGEHSKGASDLKAKPICCFLGIVWLSEWEAGQHSEEESETKFKSVHLTC